MEHKFIDAQEMQRKHPKTFEAPTQQELENVKVGDLVKVCPGSERFWVEIVAIDGKILSGFVTNQLMCSDEHGIVFGDTVDFELRHIYQTW